MSETLDKKIEFIIQKAIDASVDASTDKYINKYVNGKIDKITKEVGSIKEHLVKQDDMMGDLSIQINNLKTDTDPIVEAKKGLTSLGKIVVWLSVTVGAVLYLLSKAKLIQ